VSNTQKLKIVHRFLLISCFVAVFCSFQMVRAADTKFVLPKIVPEECPTQVRGPAGEIFTFVKTGKSTCGKYLIADTVVPAGMGPTPHIHHWTDEWFYFPEGGYMLFMGENEFPSVNVVPGQGAPRERVHMVRTKPGDLFYGKRYILHGFQNISTKDVRFFMIWTPDTPDVSILEYFKRAGSVIKDPKHLPPITARNFELFVSLAPSYGINQSSDFWQYVSEAMEGLHQMDNKAAGLRELLKSGNNGCPGTK
jgi:hypothetical protein